MEAAPLKPGGISRRGFVQGVAIASVANLTGCLPDPTGAGDGSPRLESRPGAPGTRGSTGKMSFKSGGTEIVAFVPFDATHQDELGVMLFLHGALRNVDTFVDAFQAAADAAGVIVVAPLADDGTWDAIRNSFGPDPDRIDDALSWVFERWRIDPSRIACTGFSDGATYALAIGRANGDLFHRIAAFSPGFLIGVEEVGRPRVLITHGDADIVLSVIRTREIIVPDLREFGYDVDYREFAGPHAVPLETANAFIASLGNQP